MRNTEKNSQSFHGRCYREDRFDPSMAHLRAHQTRAVAWGFGTTLVGINPLKTNWVASRSCPCIRCGDALTSVDPVWIQWSPLRRSPLPTPLKVLHPSHPQEFLASAEADAVVAVLSPQRHRSLTVNAGTSPS